LFFKNIGPAGHRIPNTDYFVCYKPVAENIIQGRGATLNGTVPFRFALGFPIILSGLFLLSQIFGINELVLVVLLNIILTALAVCLLFLVANEIFNKKIALTASILWMSYPFNLWFIKNPNTEVPFIPLLFAGFLFYILTLKRQNLKSAFLAGLFLGLASAIRLIGLFLPLYLALLIFLFLRAIPKKKQFLLVVFLLLGNIIAVSPWAAYLFSKTGNFIPLSIQGPKAISVGITWLSRPSHPVVVPNDVGELIQRVKDEDFFSYSEIFQFFGRELASRPFPLLKLIGLKAIRSWYATSEQWWEKQTLAVQAFYLLTALLGALFQFKNIKNKTLTLVLPLAVIIYFWVMTFINVSIMRYMVPVMGLVIIFSAFGLNKAVEKFKAGLKV
jgi:4-amino-4-deoxy-L-arabinose transferase-like glycosyltransferase